MLINTNIKKILGGGCEIKEVRYKDKVVWKKAPKYIANCWVRDNAFTRIDVSFNKIKAEVNSITTIASENRLLRITCEMISNSTVNIRVLRNGILIINQNITRDNTLDRLIGLNEGVNSIDIIIQRP